jgi:hypothetical protein
MMKKYIVFVIISIITLNMFSQAPEGFRYQATVRNESGEPIVNRDVSFHFTILKGDPIGISVYEENHFVSTDTYGTVALIIGDGTDKTGQFSDIDWGADIYFLNVALDTLGGFSFTDMGTSQFLSVPYALHSKTSADSFSGDYADLMNKPVTDGSETKINAGINITVSGTGTSGDPYIINSQTGIIAGNNIEVSGSGTGSDPYIVSERTHYIGEHYGGGIVFFVYDNGRHGLIAATTDLDPGIEWYNGTKRYTNTTGDGIGAGEMNTALIIALQTNDNPLGNFAAKVCADYSVKVDAIVYGDWYLPSKKELELLYQASPQVGGFQNNYYWSSTEFSSISAWAVDFSIGIQDNQNKGLAYAVRAIRAF